MKTILCYGDSNTFGARPVEFDLLDEPFIAAELRYPEEIRWPGVLQTVIGDGYRVIEEGLCGRTTTLDDPIEGTYKNGKTYLQPCLESHAPIDLVILMLGTNDVKFKYHLSAFDIALGAASLLDIITKSSVSREGGPPKMLLMAPPPVGKLSCLGELFEGAVEKSKELADRYEKVAKMFKCSFLDAGSIISTSGLDGVHFDAGAHKKLGEAVSKKVKEII